MGEVGGKRGLQSDWDSEEELVELYACPTIARR